MASLIDATKPITGNPTTASVRANFAAAKSEIEALQSDVAGKQASLGFTPENSANKGQANGYASLDSNGTVPSGQLPSYVDDVIESANYASLPGTGATSKIYVTLDDNKQYRWSGSAYVQLVASPGTTDALTEGSTNLYFTYARVRATVLTGLSTVAAAAIAATDTVLQAFEKVQAQISAKQDTLVSATNIKTVNGTSLLGSGDLVVSAGSSTLDGLTDVVITTPSNGQVLKYNGSEWVNGADATGGAGTSGGYEQQFMMMGA